MLTLFVFNLPKLRRVLVVWDMRLCHELNEDEPAVEASSSVGLMLLADGVAKAVFEY